MCRNLFNNELDSKTWPEGWDADWAAQSPGAKHHVQVLPQLEEALGLCWSFSSFFFSDITENGDELVFTAYNYKKKKKRNVEGRWCHFFTGLKLTSGGGFRRFFVGTVRLSTGGGSSCCRSTPSNLHSLLCISHLLISSASNLKYKTLFPTRLWFSLNYRNNVTNQRRKYCAVKSSLLCLQWPVYTSAILGPSLTKDDHRRWNVEICFCNYGAQLDDVHRSHIDLRRNLRFSKWSSYNLRKSDLISYRKFTTSMSHSVSCNCVKRLLNSHSV